MHNIRNMKISLVVFFLASLMTLNGCSIYDPGYSRSTQRSVPKIPEVKPQVVKRATPPRKTVQKPRNIPKRIIRTAPPKPAPRYTITSKSTTIANEQEAVAKREILKMEAKKRATVDIDPYATIPENSSSKGGMAPPAPPVMKSSSAVKSLMLRARADLAIGSAKSAVVKLERGLRIEPQNPKIWHLLAKAHYDQADYQQAITMAKKSIRYSADDKLVAQNWGLIQKAGKKSDDTIALKEALDYFKANP